MSWCWLIHHDWTVDHITQEPFGVAGGEPVEVVTAHYYCFRCKKRWTHRLSVIVGGGKHEPRSYYLPEMFDRKFGAMR